MASSYAHCCTFVNVAALSRLVAMRPTAKQHAGGRLAGQLLRRRPDPARLHCCAPEITRMWSDEAKKGVSKLQLCSDFRAWTVGGC